MKKILIVTSVASMVDQFMLPSVTVLHEMGYTVHVACNFSEGNTCSDEHIEEFKKKLADMSVTFFHVDFKRDVTRIAANRAAYKTLCRIVSQHGYDLIHCHSPIGGVLGRLAAHKFKLPVIYTAHGFHFFKGSPILNWVLFYPVEKVMSYMTDMLVTINREDYGLAKAKMKAKKVIYTHGIGVDVKKYTENNARRDAVRDALGIAQDCTLLLSVGELNENKNHKTVISALTKLESSYHYAVAGHGKLTEELGRYAEELGVGDRVHILGFRNDVADLHRAADIYIHPSHREGLSMAILEAMCSGLPVIASKIRGPLDLIDEPQGGYLCAPDDTEGFVMAIKKLDPAVREAMRLYNAQKVKAFGVDRTMQEMREIYSEFQAKLLKSKEAEK